MANRGSISRGRIAGLTVALILLAPRPSSAHPLGNFSISHYTGVRVEQDSIELRYFVDMAEIPTFQEIQETDIVPEAGYPGLSGYLARKAETLREGLVLEVNASQLRLQSESREIIFSPGAGGLPTMKLGIIYRARLYGSASTGLSHLRYRDANFPDRAGWKEIVAVEGPGVTFVSSSVPERDRSSQLTNYPTDLLNSPPQTLGADVSFTRQGSAPGVAMVGPPGDPTPRSFSPLSSEAKEPVHGVEQAVRPRRVEARVQTNAEPVRLQANQQATPRNAFTELMTTKELGVGIVLFALVTAAGLGAFHALEPGHGKTVVAAYLVGSRGTAWHALLLGLIVTASHTAGVYLLGAVTLYASRYVVPERLYPWLGVISGLTVAGLGFYLFLRRYASRIHPHAYAHPHEHDHGHHHHGFVGHSHGPQDVHASQYHQHARPGDAVSLPQLFALGVTGGIIPCPAALVVLLSAVALRRVGFGLLLIMAFSVGLAAMLIAIGLLMIYARRFMSRFQGDGLLISHWLPLTSSAVITVLGVSIAVQALVSAGILQIRL